MVTWLRSRSGAAPTPMEMETVSAGVSEPPGKKPRAEAAGGPAQRCRWRRGDREVGVGALKILTGVLVHRVARPLRGSVSCGSGWSVPCVSIQLTHAQNFSNRNSSLVMITRC